MGVLVRLIMGVIWIPIINNINANTGEDQPLYDAGKNTL